MPEQIVPDNETPIVDDSLHIGDDPIAQITELLGIEDESPDDDDAPRETDTDESPSEDEPKAETPAANPKNLNELAERLDIPVEELYAIEFPDEHGESHTLGQLKDLMGAENDYSERDAVLSEDRLQFEQDMLVARSQIEQIVKGLPPEALNPEVLALAKADYEKHLNIEADKLRVAMPEWKDPAARKADLELMAAHMKPYGFSMADLKGLQDSRLFKYLRDNQRREVHIATLTKGVKKKARDSKRMHGKQPPSKSKRQSIVERGRAATDNRGKVSAISDLLGAK
jgi:hypothetical protein